MSIALGVRKSLVASARLAMGPSIIRLTYVAGAALPLLASRVALADPATSYEGLCQQVVGNGDPNNPNAVSFAEVHPSGIWVTCGQGLNYMPSAQVAEHYGEALPVYDSNLPPFSDPVDYIPTRQIEGFYPVPEEFIEVERQINTLEYGVISVYCQSQRYINDYGNIVDAGMCLLDPAGMQNVTNEYPSMENMFQSPNQYWEPENGGFEGYYNNYHSGYYGGTPGWGYGYAGWGYYDYYGNYVGGGGWSGC